MFHGICRRFSRILSLALEPISKSSVHYLASILSSKIIIASKPRYRRCIAVDETKICINKPLVIVDKSPWYRWALERLGLEYRHERLGLRSRVERFFRYLKERMMVFHHKMSARDYKQGIRNLNLFLNLFTLYYQTIMIEGG